MVQIFLCHASEDKTQVREVYQHLKALGFAPWLDEEDILPGQDWDYEIERAIEASNFVMVFLSTRSVEKPGYVQREFRWALSHAEEMPEGRIHTIPVKLDDCSVPSRFRRHQWANLYENGAFDRIVRALHLGLQQRDLPLPEPLTTDNALEPTLTNSITDYAKIFEEELRMRYGVHAASCSTVVEVLDYDGNSRITKRWEGVKVSGGMLVSYIPEKEEVYSPGGRIINHPVLVEVKDFVKPVFLSTIDKTDNLCRFQVNIVGSLTANDPVLSYTYKIEALKAFLMTKEEAAKAYKGSSFSSEYYVISTFTPTELMKLEIIFPERYSAQAFPGVFFGKSEYLHSLELQRVQEGFQRTSRGAVFTIVKPLIGFRYFVHWVPLSQKEVDILRSRS